jgi:hypothetical protein
VDQGGLIGIRRLKGRGVWIVQGGLDMYDADESRGLITVCTEIKIEVILR